MPRISGFAFLLCMFGFASLPVWPQAGVRSASFEAASIREHTGPLRVMRGLSVSGTLVRFEGFTPHMLVQEAYGLNSYEVAFEGQALASIYNITARAAGDAPISKPEMRQMLQTLLAERFQLKFHRESRQLDVYALSIAKSGSKLKESTGGDECRAVAGPVNPEDRNYRYSLTACPLSSLVNFIVSGGADRPVVDQTGLDKTYDILISATPEFRLRNSTEPGDVSIFDVLQSELGLRLESRKAPFDILVIDHIEKPLEN
jgi:uncharacterized protein (TIGR03435 family)